MTAPTNDDERTLSKLLSHLWETRKKKKYLFGRGDGSNNLCHYIDGAFACHMDGKSHRGLVVEYGMSIINSDSGKHKVCTKDSTKTEGVSVSNYVVRIEWFGDFLTGQGEKIVTTTLLQDNSSCILILKDPTRGKLRTRNIKARFGMANEYLVVNKGVRIEHLKTALMLADAMTKPLSHPIFKIFASRLLNHITWEEMVRRVRPEADDREVWKAMGLQWADGTIGSQGEIKSSTKCTTKDVSILKNQQQGAKAVSWKRNLKTSSTSTCYAPIRKNRRAERSSRSQEMVFSVVLRRLRIGLEVGAKTGGEFQSRCRGSEVGGVVAAPQHSRNRIARFRKAGNGSLVKNK